VTILAAVVSLASGCGSAGRRGAVIASPASIKHSGVVATTRSRLACEGLLIPATYKQACRDEGAVCTGSSETTGLVPPVLDRPLHFPVVRPGERCPATPGRPISNPYLAGVALGTGPVRPLIASAGDLRHGIADLDPAETPGWREFKTLWFSVPAYQGPFVIRAQRLDGPGPILLGGSGALPANPHPIVLPPGPTLNGGGGWRTAPSGTWARSPGCYAWQIDGTTFSEVIVVHAVWFGARASGSG